MKKILILAAIASVSTPAFATSPEVVNFKAKVAEVCDVSGYDTLVDFGTLSSTGDAAPYADGFSVYCNVRFNATLESDNGRLLLNNPTGTLGAVAQAESAGNASGYPGFDAALDYSVTGTIGSFGFSEDTTSINASAPTPLNTAPLPPVSVSGSISYDTLGGNNMLGGTYNDTLTLILTPVSF
jgi:spore coat protein U-like protein